MRRVLAAFATIALLAAGCRSIGYGRPQPRREMRPSGAALTAGEAAISGLRGFDLAAWATFADEIVLARVSDQRSRPVVTGEGDRIIRTANTLVVDRGVKGNLRSGDAIVVETDGGTVGDVTLIVFDGPSFQRDETVLLFIAASPVERRVLGGARGIVHLDPYGTAVEIGAPLQHAIASIEQIVARRESQ